MSANTLNKLENEWHEKAKKEGYSVNKEQIKALRYITNNDSKIKVISGMAGTGKTTLLKVANSAWMQSGYKVIGASLAGKAADELEKGADIKSKTLHSTLFSIEKDISHWMIKPLSLLMKREW